MQKYSKSGVVMTYAVPAGGVVSDGVYLIGGLFVVATNTVAFAAGATFEGRAEGVFTLPKTANEGNLAEGQSLYWDVANARVTIDNSLGLPIGSVGKGGALTAAVTCPVRLYGASLVGRVINVRKRVPIATINAGGTLVPAIAGMKYRMIAASAIAIGGAVGAVTTVDIKGVQAAASVKLVAFAQASLTQSSELKSGGAGAAILADGASYVANDANTAITFGITGANATVATNIDLSFTYQIDA